MFLMVRIHMFVDVQTVYLDRVYRVSATGTGNYGGIAQLVQSTCPTSRGLKKFTQVRILLSPLNIVIWMNGIVTSLIHWVRKNDVGSNPTVTTN